MNLKTLALGAIAGITMASTVLAPTLAQSTTTKPPASAVASWTLQSPNQPGGSVAWVKTAGKNAWYVDAPVAPGDGSSLDSLAYNISGLGSTLFRSFSLTIAHDTGGPDKAYECILVVTIVGPQGQPQSTIIPTPFAKGQYDSAVTTDGWTTYTWSNIESFSQGKNVTGIQLYITQQSPSAQYDTSFYLTNPTLNGYVIPQSLSVSSAQ